MIERIIKPRLLNSLFKGKAAIIYGARQVGKTTLMQEIERASNVSSLYLNCDEPDVRRALTEKTSTELKALIGKTKLLLIDEAQRVTNIGITLKLFVDAIPETQVIATGSSSFELSNRIVEPLTGRKVEFHLHPFSLEELRQLHSPLERGAPAGDPPDFRHVPGCGQQPRGRHRNPARADPQLPLQGYPCP